MAASIIAVEALVEARVYFYRTVGLTIATGRHYQIRPFNLTQSAVFDILSVRIFAEIAISVGVMSTYFPSGKGLAENRKWLVVDAKGKTVGRLATEVARILSGKNNPAWTPYMDMGEHCIVINARHAMFTGAKDDQKIYYRHTAQKPEAIEI